MVRHVLGAVMMGAAVVGSMASAHAAMEVRDSTNLSQAIKEFKESIKQTEIFTTISEVNGAIQDGVDMVNETVGPAASLALTASSWMQNADGAMQCLVPDLGMFGGMNVDVTSPCEAAGWVRDQLGVPSALRLDMGGQDSWMDYLQDDGTGGGGWTDPDGGGSTPSTGSGGLGGGKRLTPAEMAEMEATIRGKRRAVAVDSLYDGVALGLSMKTSAGEGVQEALAGFTESADVTTLQQRVGQTNAMLSRILIELQHQRAVLAQLLIVQASDRLRQEPVFYRVPDGGTWFESGASKGASQIPDSGTWFEGGK